MKAVVMAGGEGTRLRPLTSNQPKPMVPIVGRPCMEHIVNLLKEHDIEDIVVTLAFMPQAIRTYFGDGEPYGVRMRYSVEESPAGTAGSVRLAADELDDTFVVISGDALCDVDLSELVAAHRRHEASVTIGLKSVENPLEFGIVVCDEDGRIERFLEKPSWGQVFSDTINTGIYVLEPEVLRHVPEDRPFDFSKELFPLLLEMGRPLYGHVMDGYWQDIGNLDQFRQANFDALDERIRLDVPGIRLRGNIWLGEGVELDIERIEGPAFVGNYCRIELDRVRRPVRRARLGRHGSRARLGDAGGGRCRDLRRPERDGRRRDRRTLVRPARARANPRGSRDRRRLHARAGERRHARDPDLPLQGGRVGHGRRSQRHLGVARRVGLGGSAPRCRASSTSTSRRRLLSGSGWRSAPR